MADLQALFYGPYPPMPGTLLQHYSGTATQGYRHINGSDRYSLHRGWPEQFGASAIGGHLLTQLHNRMALAWVPQPQPRTHTCSLALRKAVETM